MAGPAGAPHVPVPWASVAEGSHLLPPEAVRDAVEATGLRQRQWRDLTAEAKAWSAKAAAAQASTKVPSGKALILGPDFAEIGRASCRERVGQYVALRVGDVASKKTKKQTGIE